MTANMSPSCPSDADFDERDVTAIDKLLRNVGECFAAGDMESWSDLFAERSDFITWGGMWWTSRVAIREGHDAIPSPVTAQLPAYRFEPLKWEMLSPTVAIAHGRWDWPDFQAGDAPKEDRAGLLTLTLLRIVGRWKIRAAQNTRIDITLKRAR